ncbi:MAG: MarR family transcriptional regulator [Lachnospiraceae bacterium]|nr:MarR family transcriptional regulator [Lachnospiraceae bacterium]
MNIEDTINSNRLDFEGIPSSYYLLGLLSAFENRFQAMADSMMKEISWKQFFAIICISMCKEPPTIKELSDVLGSSHQNVKQILIKLEDKGFVEFREDESDKRKQRVVLTKKCMRFCEKNNDMSIKIMSKMFEGVPEKDIKTTIKTITRIEKNISEAV